MAPPPADQPGTAEAADRAGVIRLGRVGSIGIFIHWSWFIVAALVTAGLQGWLTTVDEGLDRGLAWLLAIGGALVFFGSVLIHELAHAFMAKARGIEVGGITLFAFGGATEADASSQQADDELVIAIVGPLASLAVAAVLGVVWFLGGGAAGGTGAGAGAGVGAPIRLVGYLAVLNAVLAVFNLVPGFPLDGGRVLRALVWRSTGDFARATRLAAVAGAVVGYLLIGLGLVEVWGGGLGGLWLVAIGWMIASSAGQTGTADQLRETFAGYTAADLMSSPVVTIPAGTTVSGAVTGYLSRHSFTVFPVVSESGTGLIGTIGVASVQGLGPDEARALTVARLATPIDAASLVAPDRPAADVIRLLAEGRGGTRVLVVDDGWPIGIVSPRDIVRQRALVDLLPPPTE